MAKVKPLDWVVLNYPILLNKSKASHRNRIITYLGESYAANYLEGLGYFFCYNKIWEGLAFLREAYVMNSRAERPLEDWCEVAYAFAIASIVRNTEWDVDIGITELGRINMAAAYSTFSLADIRRETIRRLQLREMVVLRRLPAIRCPCGVGPCQFIDNVLGCQGINASIPEVQECCMRCVATVEYMKFRSEYIHCL